jgi:hypothetical protein
LNITHMLLLEKLPKIPRNYRSGLLASTMLLGSILQVLPAWAAGTTAGTTISNTAQATYSDNTGVPQPPTTSNTVTVIVAEVAGISVTGAGITPATAGAVITPGSTIYYDYVVTNSGNDPTRFTIPNLATVTSGPGSVTGNLQIDLDGDGVFETTITAGSFTTADIPVNGTVKVRVPILVNGAATTGQQITVQLGNTPGDAQNQERTAANSQAGDIFTVDGTTAADAASPPINGIREASASQIAIVGSAPQAFAAILKNSAYSNNGTATPLTDDKITYGLSLRVDNVAPTGSTGFSPAPLAGTAITVDTASVTRVLVSDAIPQYTTLSGTPVAPAGWTIVYTTDATTVSSNAAQWTTAVPTGTVTRVGFINNGPINAGTTVTGFSFQVVTSSIPAAGANVLNIAQTFGSTPGATGLVYDESGDQNPSNFTDGPTPVPDPFNPATNTGVAGAGDGTDPGSNTGTGSDGEDNIVNVGAPSTLANGPLAAPAAIGPTSNNDDFSNKAAQLVGTDPNPVGFTNTLQNAGTSAAPVSLVPGPTTAAALPDGTKVTISYGGQSATYTYTGGIPALTTGSAVIIPAADLPAGGTANYGVSVDLPAGVAQNTPFTAPIVAFVDSGTAGLDGGDVQNTTLTRVYVGFMTLAKTARVLSADGSTILVPAGTALTGNIPPGSIIEYVVTYKNVSEAQAGSGNNAVLDAKNIVVTENGTLGGVTGNNWALDNDTNSILDTSNVLGSSQDSSGTGAVTFFSGATGATSTSEQTGTTAATDVTKYVDTVTGPIGPGISKTFTFRRRIN